MRPLLPQLRNTLAAGPIQGQWNLSSKSIFGTIAQALKYEQAVRTNINSIPSPWARALLFQSVFLSEEYPNRQDHINEYFGFIAVLAFAKVKDLPIQAKAVKLDELARVNPFADSLVGLLPSAQDSLFQSVTGSNPWETIYTFSLNGYPLGFSSPATLAVPSIWLSPQLSSYIPWLEEIAIPGPGNRGKTIYKYGDPKHHLAKHEKSAFAAWLINIKQSVLTIGNSNQDLSNRLGMIIDEYIKTLGVASATTPSVSTSLQIFGVALNPKPLDALAQVIDPESNKRNSNVQVLPGMKPHVSPLYFVDKDLVPQVLNLPSHEICVVGATTLAAFGKVPNAANQKGTFWNADNFFLPRLRWFRASGIFPGSWLDEIQPDRENRTIIPPMDPEIIKFFSSEDLRSRLKMALVMTSEGSGVRISFELEISGVDNHSTRLAIYKDYSIKSEDELQGEIPYISLWPNLPSESRWSTFYLAVLETKVRSNSKVAFVVDQPTQDSIGSELDGDLDTIIRIWQSNKYPNVLSLLDKRGDHIGILPILTPHINTNRSSKWIIGVDFGTSFTNLHVSKSGSRERLELSSLTLNVSQTPENLITDTEFFVPGILTAPRDGSNPPMATLLTVRGRSETETTPDFITNSRVYVPTAEQRCLFDYVVSDIKWTKPKYLDAFLTALINMVSAHAAKSDVSEITWKASYPTAFSTTKVSKYINAWERALLAAEKVSNIRHKLGDDGTAATAFQTESIAFAQYFADELKEQLVYTTCLDVGGGTSDISIWKDMELIHQLSIPFAGRDIFHNTLSWNISRVGEVFGLSEQLSEALLLDLKNSGDNFDAYLDSYLRLEGGTVLERLRNAGNTRNIQKFRGLLALSYAGLYYYIGLVLRYLNQESSTPVCIGGNGSRFINWIDPDGKYSTSSEINKLLGYILAKAGGFSTVDRRDTVLSKHPKEEAAGGLIVDKTQLKGLSRSSPAAFAGIDMKFETDIGPIIFKAQDELILPQECQEIKSIAIEDLSEIANFMEVFNEAIRVCGIQDIVTPISARSGTEALNDISFDLGNEIKQILNSRFTKKGGSSQNYEPDPGFIVAHKGLLRVLAKQWAKN